MKIAFIITVSVIIGVSSLLALIRFIFSSIRKKMNTYIQTNFDQKDILGATTSANFLGKESQGGKQIRGNGALVLTKNEIYFFRALPFKEYSIPLNSVIKVSLPSSFNGKSVLSKLLSIQYKTSSGSETMAWALKNPESWKQTIEKLVSPET